MLASGHLVDLLAGEETNLGLAFPSAEPVAARKWKRIESSRRVKNLNTTKTSMSLWTW